jgi:hypothetical protein
VLFITLLHAEDIFEVALLILETAGVFETAVF